MDVNERLRRDTSRGSPANFKIPEKIVDYFKLESEKAMRRSGYSIDRRRKFTTTDPTYKKFIEWQYIRLEEKDLIVKGSTL